MHRRSIVGALTRILAALAVLSASPVAWAGLVDHFSIGLEQPVSNGVPGPGAGNLEAAGAVDEYEFIASAGASVYFDEMSGGCSILWKCQAPDGSLLFNNNAICVTDPGTIVLTQTGTYLISVYSTSGATGVYSFTLWDVNPPELFTIDLKQTVSNGSPGPGAGNLEEPGAIDQYTFTAAPGTLVYFDELSGGCSILWKCVDSANAALFNNHPICVTDPGTIDLTVGGTYTITVYSNSGATGAYSFRVWEVNAAEIFLIGLKQVVSNGNPGPGAGNLEEPAAVDQYIFSVEPGTLVYFDELSGGCNIQWTCQAPDKTALFTNNPICVTDPGSFLLDQTGDYTISVFGSGGASGTYSFILNEVNPTQSFAIGLEQIVSDGVPAVGAGNIEEPAAIDEYTFTIDSPTDVFFDELSGGCSIQWKCTAPDNSAVFANNPICITDPGAVTLAQTGTYTLRVSGSGGATGVYSFILWEINPPEQFSIALDEIVMTGAPAAGAGNVEEPGAIDRYILNVRPGQVACFEELSGPCDLQWMCEDSTGDIIFSNDSMCSPDPGKRTLELGGDYTITVSGVGDGTGTYSFIVNTGRGADINGDCIVNVNDLLAVINAWGNCPAPPEACPADIDPPGGNGAVNVNDLLAVINDWG